MDQLSAEKRLAITYALCIAVGAITSITVGTAWSHWYGTMDQCVDRNCSCILYGEHTPTVFLGGPQAPCIWVTFGPLFYVFFAFGLAWFHGYRVLFTTKSPMTRTSRTVLTQMEPGQTVQIQAVSQETTSTLPRAFWICVSVLSVFFTVYALIHFAIFVDGYYKTCNQYRLTLMGLLGVPGSARSVISSRLTCQAIFDFMDFMQRDTGNAHRNGIMNTGVDLIFGLISAGLSWILLLHTSILNIGLSRVRS